MTSSAFYKMDRMYRHQRFFYDATRKYYLLGRDRLLREMEIRDGESVLEIGCGTGRNLAILAKQYPLTHFFGLDASSVMLKSAEKKIRSKHLTNVRLKTALAEEFSHLRTFDKQNAFDTIFFSYSLSMIPPWRESIENALRNLKPGRSFYIVDFYDQKDLPVWFRRILQLWLKQFHVRYPEKLVPFLKDLESKGAGKLHLKSVFKSYSFIARFEKS